MEKKRCPDNKLEVHKSGLRLEMFWERNHTMFRIQGKLLKKFQKKKK